MQSDTTLLVSESTVQVDASVNRVWEVLTKTAHIRQWDDVPEAFLEPSVSQDSVLEWAGFSRLTVTQFEPGKCLRYAYHHPKWEKVVDGIDYSYHIQPLGDSSVLTVRVGDWSVTPDGKGQMYHDASVEFVADAANKIKQIAEG